MNISWAQWDVGQINSSVWSALGIKRQALDVIKSIPATDRTFTNTIAALERAGDEVSDISHRLQLLMNVHPDADVRTTCQEANDRLESANLDLDHDRGLWAAATQWQERGEHINGADKKLADDILRDMRRIGFALAKDDFHKLKANRKRLQRMETEFEKTINDYEDGITVTREELSGLSERYISGLTREADGRYRISLQYPELFQYMKYAESDARRRELAGKHLRRGGEANMARLAEMIMLRQANAKLLGYPTHADYVTEPRMAGTARAAREFLNDLIAKLSRAADRELRDMADIKGGRIHFHEMEYWSERLRRKLYDLDSEKVSEYFPLAHVITAMMDIYQEILGVRFAKMDDIAAWHPDVSAYEVFDAQSGETIGYFFLDLFPRSGKYGHAAVFPITLGRTGSDGRQVNGMVALVCNFPKPTANNPSLLSHNEVETLFHEFGHVMHALLSGGTYQRQNGFGVAHDFIEALSQIFENWTWHRTILPRLSSHFRTGDPLPQDLLDKMLAARRHGKAIYHLRQAVRALYDLRMHGQPTDEPVQADRLAKMYRHMVLQYLAIDLPEDSIFAAGWGHMADYDAGYYGYLWSQVYADDMFTRFAFDPLNTDIGRDYRNRVLVPGASRPEHQIVEDFLGRPSTSDAFLNELGIQ